MKNKTRIEGDVAYVLVSENKQVETTVDVACLSRLSQYRWCVMDSGGGNYYVYTTTGLKKRKMKLHDFLCITPEGKTVDHIDGNRLNNRLNNLRAATHTEQMRNSRRQKPKSGYRGVRKNGKKGWAAYITYEKNYVHLGTFSTKEEAAITYDQKAVELFGEFAVTNKQLGWLKYEV